jgi:hypothetical protein
MGYEVTVDGNTEEVGTKKEVDATLKEVLADGETHEVAVAKAEPEAPAEEEAAAADKGEDEGPAGVGGVPVVL